MIRFEWDSAKAASNLRKHRVSFELAMRVFSDPFALSEQDRIEGIVLLLVAHAVRDEGDVEVIRIISARRAERQERRRYEQANR
jgi:uncharacterized DUF497 family protein